MVLHNVTMPNGTGHMSIKITDGKIAGIYNDKIDDDDAQLDLNGAYVFPGLINSHDHLDFNLFNQLGNRCYKNYMEWGKHLHGHHKTEINKVLKVPQPLREQWGLIKNLIAGVTTVVNHGEKIKTPDPIITVFEHYYCIHSVGFEKKWLLKLNNPLKTKYPVVVHIGEGTDPAAFDEINRLLRWNLLRKPVIGVHGVAMNGEQAARFEALVWCPQSNYFLLHKTADVNVLKKHTKILFGTDSTLTGNWSIWDHIAQARKTGMLSDAELYNSLTENAANIWGINSGKLVVGADADLIITAPKNEIAGQEAFFLTEPRDILLVMHKGKIKLADASLKNQVCKTDMMDFSEIKIEGITKYIASDVPGLTSEIKHYYPEATFPIEID